MSQTRIDESGWAQNLITHTKVSEVHRQILPQKLHKLFESPATDASAFPLPDQMEQLKKLLASKHPEQVKAGQRILSTYILSLSEKEEVRDITSHLFAAMLNKKDLTWVCPKNFSFSESQLAEPFWRAIIKASTAFKLTTLGMHDNHLANLKEPRWKEFLDIFKNCADTLRTIEICGDDLTSLSEKKRHQLLDAIHQVHHLRSFSIRNVDLAALDTTSFNKVLGVISKGSVEAVDMSMCNLGGLSSERIQLLAGALKKSCIIKLDICNNNLWDLGKSDLHALQGALIQSPTILSTVVALSPSEFLLLSDKSYKHFEEFNTGLAKKVGMEIEPAFANNKELKPFYDQYRLAQKVLHEVDESYTSSKSEKMFSGRAPNMDKLRTKIETEITRIDKITRDLDRASAPAEDVELFKSNLENLRESLLAADEKLFEFNNRSPSESPRKLSK